MAPTYQISSSAVSAPRAENQMTIQPSFEGGTPMASSMPCTGKGDMASSLV